MPSLKPKETGDLHIRLHRAQHDFCHSPALYRAFVGGRGSGKSWAGSYDMICKAGLGKRSNRLYLVASPTYTVLADTTFRTFTEIARDMGQLAGIYKQPPSIRLTNGSEILFRSADNPEKLRGPNLSGVWLDEASLMSHDAFNICIASLRQGGRQGWLSATFTPKGLTHWTYEYFGRPRPDTELFHAETRDNPFNPPEFAATLAKQYVARLAEQELGGLFVAIDGAEWPMEYFSDDIWFDLWPRDMHIKVIALDPSKGRDARPATDKREADYSAFVFAGLTGDGTIWVDADLNNRRSAEQIVQDAVSHCRLWKPTAFVIETNNFQELFEPLFKTAFTSANVALPGYKINNHVNKQVRIRSLGPTLAGVDGRFRFRAGSEGAKLLVQQLRDFPVGQYDDGPDALEQAVRIIRFLLHGQCEMGTPKILRA